MNTLTEDPNHDLDEECAEASTRLLDTGKFGEVQHGKAYPDLIADCDAVAQAALQAHNDYLLTHGLGDGKMRAKEMAVPEHYMENGR